MIKLGGEDMTETFLDISLYVMEDGEEYEYQYGNMKHAQEHAEIETSKGNAIRIVVNK
jgi:hypothetical protein